MRKFWVGVGLVALLWIVFDPLGDDEIPESVREAATDHNWAAGQQKSLGDRRVTTGRFVTNKHPKVREITSGWVKGLSDRATDILRESPHFPDFRSDGRPNVAGDVETKVAMIMREEGAIAGVLVINHPKMCEGPMGCSTAVAAILPQGATLHVWELDAPEPVEISGKADT